MKLGNIWSDHCPHTICAMREMLELAANLQRVPVSMACSSPCWPERGAWQFPDQNPSFWKRGAPSGQANSLSLSLLKRLRVFGTALDLQEKWEEGTEVSQWPPAPTHAQSPSHYRHPRQSGTPVRTDEPALTHQNHHSPYVHRSHAGSHLLLFSPWVWTKHGDMYPPLQYHTGYLGCLKNPLCNAGSFLEPS